MRGIWLGLALFVPFAAWAQPAPLQQAPQSGPGSGIQVPDLHLDQLRPPNPSASNPSAPNPSAPQTPATGAQRQGAVRPPPKPQETDDQLLAKLAKAADKTGAHKIEQELEARWSHSGSPSADLLLKRADQAIEAEDTDTARAIIQKLTDIAPDFAEAWHRRASLASDHDDYQDALVSLRHTLTLRPKHFMALAELGEILEEFNDKPHALEAYRQAKALDPFIDGLDDHIRDLSKSVEGQGI